MNRARQARELVRGARSGTLSTHSLELPGYPYGSALPHGTDARGRPLVLISHLAEHTRNLAADVRASFLIAASGADLQSAPRVTLVGDMRVLDDPQRVERRYLRFFPEHARYLEIGGFHFYALEPVRVRFIEGFGSLHWLDGAHYLAEAPALADAENDIVEHMNQDHVAALRDYCRHQHSIIAESVSMAGIDCDGFDVQADGQLLRFAFAEPVFDALQARSALVEMARAARA